MLFVENKDKRGSSFLKLTRQVQGVHAIKDLSTYVICMWCKCVNGRGTKVVVLCLTNTPEQKSKALKDSTKY